MSTLLALFLFAAQESPIVIRTTESVSPETFPAVELAPGEVGVVVGTPGGPAADEMLATAGWIVPGGPGRTVEVAGRKVAFVVRDGIPKADLVVLVAPGSREEAADQLRKTPGVGLCIVTGRGGGDPEPLRIGDAWIVQAPGDGRLWGRVEVRLDAQGKVAAVTNGFSAPEGKGSEKIAGLKKKHGLPADPIGVLRENLKAPAAPAAPPPLETSNRACRLRIVSATERAEYAGKAGRLLVLDAEFENIIPMTLIQSNQVPTMYKIKDLADHLYLVVNGSRVSRLPADSASLSGHVKTAGFALERLGSRVRGNLVFELPANAEVLDLRFYDYAHGHMTLALRKGPAPEAKPVIPLQDNEILEAAVFGVTRVKETLVVELRARSRMFTEGDATAFDPKAKPGDKLRIGTVSDWKDMARHLHLVVDGEYSHSMGEGADIAGEPRFLPDVFTGGRVNFAVPEKVVSMELRLHFPNALLPDGTLVHPKPLTFVLEGKRPELPARPAIVEIEDDVFKVAVTGQAKVAEFAGVKGPFLVLDVTVHNSGAKGETFQTPDQLHYATEKGAQLAMHEASFKGPRPPAKLLFIPSGERRSFQAAFAIPVSDKRPRLAYRGISKAATVELKPLARACPKCSKEAEPNEKFCAECGTKL